MTDGIRRELFIPRPPNIVWNAIANSTSLAEWMYPNNFEPRVGHRFTFDVPPNPKVGFKGLVVHCEVLECEMPSRLAFSWEAGELRGTRVTFQLESEGSGTHVLFEHTGFDLSQKIGQQALAGAGHGWTKMLNGLSRMASEMFVNSSEVQRRGDSL